MVRLALFLLMMPLAANATERAPGERIDPAVMVDVTPEGASYIPITLSTNAVLTELLTNSLISDRRVGVCKLESGSQSACWNTSSESSIVSDSSQFSAVIPRLDRPSIWSFSQVVPHVLSWSYHVPITLRRAGL
jgi:hypothetical protein